MRLFLGAFLSICFATLTCLGQDGDHYLSILHPPFIVESKQPHYLRVLNEGTSSFNQILDLIEGAQETISLETFVFHRDMGGKLIIQTLIKKAQAGVKVRLLLDHSTMFLEINDIFARRLAKTGIEVRYFNRAIPFSSKDIFWRNHRKLIVVDRKRAMLGGRNIGDEYFDQSSDYNFLDRDVFIDGAIVESIARSFDLYWNSKETSKPVIKWYNNERINGYTRLKSIYQEADQFFRDDKASKARLLTHRLIGRPLFERSPLIRCDHALFASDSPRIPKRSYVNELFLKFMAETKEHLLIETPYFILKHQGYQHLLNFLDSKGQFTMLTNGLYSTDVGLVQATFMERVLEPLRKGGQIYIYGGRRPTYPMISTAATKAVWGIHSKVAVFDRKHTLISTFNLDPRSANFNHELAFVCLDNPILADLVSENIYRRIQQAGKLGLDGKPIDNRYPYMKAPIYIKAGLFFFSPLIRQFDDFL